MKITFLIGNGFDASFGIESSYEQFYDWYITQPSTNKGAELLKVSIQEERKKAKIENRESLWADFEIGLGLHTANFDINTVQLFIEGYNDSQKQMITYLVDKSKDNVLLNLDQSKKDKLREGLTNFFDELPPLDKNEFKTFFTTRNNEDIMYNFISFNYTDALDTCIKQISEQNLKEWTQNNRRRFSKINKNVIHVHGTIDRFPILGVNDESQIVNKDLLAYPRFKELIIKPKSVEGIREEWHNLTASTIKNSDIICIFGMSLGKTDAIWWKTINEWLLASTNHRIIIYWYEKSGINRLSPFEYLTKIDDIKRKLCSFSNLTDDQLNLVESKIFIIINTNKLFKIK